MTSTAPAPVAPPLTDNDVDTFIQFLNEQDDCECEAYHTQPGNQVCSNKVVARIDFKICSKNGYNICQKALDYANQLFANPRNVCQNCYLPLADCWKIRPI